MYLYIRNNLLKNSAAVTFVPYQINTYGSLPIALQIHLSMIIEYKKKLNVIIIY